MSLIILNEKRSVLDHFLAKIRDIDSQKDKANFRKNIEKCGEMLAYELSKDLSFSKTEIQTPLAKVQHPYLVDNIVLGCVLRASLPLYQGFLNYFEDAESGFIGAARIHQKGSKDVSVDASYFAFPKIEGKTLIIVDPMLATGKSMLKSIEHATNREKPSRLIIVSLIAAPEGIQYLRENLKQEFTLYTAALDTELNDNFYIVPGLGDAGDLAFGEKL